LAIRIFLIAIFVFTVLAMIYLITYVIAFTHMDEAHPQVGLMVDQPDHVPAWIPAVSFVELDRCRLPEDVHSRRRAVSGVQRRRLGIVVVADCLGDRAIDQVDPKWGVQLSQR